MTQALEGVRIIDFSRQMSAPYATVLLGDYGADVVKVESLPHGDGSRRTGTAFVDGESGLFLMWNRNKRSLAVNLRDPASREIVHRLVRDSDVLVENFRPGVAEDMGIGYEEMAQLNPRLIYASLTAFGPTGPMARYPGTDPVVQAMSGVMSLTGERGGGPVLVGLPIADFTGAMVLTQGILLGLLARDRTGKGRQRRHADAGGLGLRPDHAAGVVLGRRQGAGAPRECPQRGGALPGVPSGRRRRGRRRVGARGVAPVLRRRRTRRPGRRRPLRHQRRPRRRPRRAERDPRQDLQPAHHRRVGGALLRGRRPVRRGVLDPSDPVAPPDGRPRHGAERRARPARHHPAARSADLPVRHPGGHQVASAGPGPAHRRRAHAARLHRDRDRRPPPARRGARARARRSLARRFVHAQPAGCQRASISARIEVLTTSTK